MSEAARRAGPEDVPGLVDLVRKGQTSLTGQRGGALWAEREARGPLDEAALAALVADPGAVVVVGTFDGVVVGYGIAQLEELRDGTTIAVIDGVYVEQDARGVGVGEAIMEELLAWSREHGCRGIDGFALPGDRQTKNFFERFGLTARAILVHRPLDPDEGARATSA